MFSHGHRNVPGQVPALGSRGITLSPNPSGDVSPSGSFREKGGGTHGLSRPLAWAPTSGPAGGHLCCLGSGAPDPQEIGNLYCEVYKLRRLPGSRPYGPKPMEELTANVVSSLKDCQRQKEGQPPGDLEEHGLADAPSPRSNTPKRWRRGTSTERDLTEMSEAHQRALATAATLEEKIERLSWSVTRGWLDACIHFWSHDHCRRRSQGQNRRHHRVRPEEGPALLSEYCPPQWGPGSREDKEATPPFLDFNLEPVVELGPDTRCQLFPPGAGLQCRGWWQKQFLPRTPSEGVWEMGHLVSTDAQYTWLGGQCWQKSLRWMTTGG